MESRRGGTPGASPLLDASKRGSWVNVAVATVVHDSHLGPRAGPDRLGLGVPHRNPSVEIIRTPRVPYGIKRDMSRGNAVTARMFGNA